MSYYRQGPFRPGGGGVQIGVPSLTPMVKTIIVTTVAVFLAQWFLQLFVGRDVLTYLLGLRPSAVVRGSIWQPLTYMLLHGGFTHILFNMLMLWMFGGDLERRWGSRAFLRYYVVTGVGAAAFVVVLAYLMPMGRPGIPTIGASGAIFGLLVAFGVLFGERRILFMLLFPVKARTMVIIMFVITLMSTLNQQANNPVSHAAHLGGAVVGFAYLKRVWRIGAIWREIRWKIQRRRFKVMDGRDDDRWIH